MYVAWVEITSDEIRNFFLFFNDTCRLINDSKIVVNKHEIIVGCSLYSFSFAAGVVKCN